MATHSLHPAPVSVATWRDRTATVLMLLAAAGACVAFVSSISTVAAAGPAASSGSSAAGPEWQPGGSPAQGRAIGGRSVLMKKLGQRLWMAIGPRYKLRVMPLDSVDLEPRRGCCAYLISAIFRMKP